MASYLLSLAALAAFVHAAPQAGQTYTISPASHPDLCVVPNGDWNGARLMITDCDNSDEIAWYFDGQSMKNSATNRCVDVLDGGHWNGNGLQAWDCFDYNTNQRFGTGGGSIQWQGTGMCLDLTDGQSTDGTLLQLWQCFDGNTNQQWVFGDVEEVDDCTESSAPTSTTPVSSASASASASPLPTSFSASASSSAPSSSASAGSDDCDDDGQDEDGNGDDDDCDASGVSSMAPSVSATPTASASASANSTIGGGLWANGTLSASASASASWNNTSASYSASASASLSASASSSDWWNEASSSSAYPSATASPSASASDSWSSASASTSPSATSSSSASTPVVTGNTNADYSGYQQTSGTNIVDASGNVVQWKGTNLGGWLVWEDWMCGITDNSGNADRFPQTTLEQRFGEDQTRALMKVWQDNWLVESDFDNMAAMGFNILRLPFSYRNFVRSDGSYITDSNGQLDYSRLEWAIAQAKKRGMFVIPTYHIWEGQEQKYSTISEDSTEGQQQRNRCGELWTMIAQHFAGETAIAAFDAINEPTGSANNNLQRDLYHAIRKGDPKRIIVMESIANQPDSDWTNVVYSMHEYLMMGENDFGYNQYMFQQGPVASQAAFTAVGMPTYVGEFMASGQTLDYMLQQMNGMGMSWSSWALKTVNMDRWGLYNFGGQMRVDVSADSFDSIQNVWSNMGPIYKSRVADNYAAATGGNAPGRRSLPAEQVVEAAANKSESDTIVYARRRSGSNVASSALRRSTPHAGRSRRGVAGLLHGKW